MNGYSKMNVVSKIKSRSMDFSPDLLSTSSLFYETPNPKTEIPETNLQEIKKNPVNTNNSSSSNSSNSSSSNTQDSFSFAGQEDDYHHVYNNNNNSNGEKFGRVKLSRNSSVSASASALQTAVKRAFSMRRSSSVSESYCRIHDQSVTLASPIDDDEDFVVEMGRSRSVKILKKKTSSKSKILKACKKIFGL